MGDNKNTKSKLLVCVNEKPHSETVLRFACSKAKNTGNQVQMIYVIDPLDYHSIFGMGDKFKEDCRSEAQELLDKLVEVAKEWSGITPTSVIREGKVLEEIISSVEEDHDIGLLLLGVSASGSKGKLLPKLSNAIGNHYHIPLMIVPGNLTDQQILDLN